MALSASISGLTITATAPAGTNAVRWYVDGNWRTTDKRAPYAYTANPATWSLGSHVIEARYLASSGIELAREQISVTKVSDGSVVIGVPSPTPEPEPPTPPAPLEVPVNAWRGRYYAGTAFETLVLERIDATINLDVGSGSPAPGVPVDSCSVRWEGDWDIPATGIYRVTATSDDGIRVWIHGHMILDRWVDRSPTTDTVDVALAAERVRIVVEYFEHLGTAMCRVGWSAAELGDRVAVIAPYSVEVLPEIAPESVRWYLDGVAVGAPILTPPYLLYGGTVASPVRQSAGLGPHLIRAIGQTGGQTVWGAQVIVEEL